jgi:RNA polymerase sigma-70 factor, ECF subfamily
VFLHHGEANAQPDKFAALMSAVVGRAPGSDAELLEVVYKELRAIAGSHMRGLRADQTLQPTALVHEAFIKMVAGRETAWESRAHFIAVAAKAMRQILIDHARAKRAEKRGGDAQRLTLSGVMLSDSDSDYDALDVDAALTKLASVDVRQARIVELRFFAGLKVPEVALVMDVSERTVELDWRMARAWLRRELKGDAS